MCGMFLISAPYYLKCLKKLSDNFVLHLLAEKKKKKKKKKKSTVKTVSITKNQNLMNPLVCSPAGETWLSFCLIYCWTLKKIGGSFVAASYQSNVACANLKDYMLMTNMSFIEIVLIYIFRLCSIVICMIV